MKNERNYGIDLLRIVLMYMVCILHTLGCGGVLAACTEGTTPHKVFWLLEILSYCAVDAFALISGYTATDKMRKFEESSPANRDIESTYMHRRVQHHAGT